MKTKKYIMCAQCHARGTITNNAFPEKCPRCGNPFNPRPQENTITDVLYNIIVRNKPEKGYFETDRLGWVKGTELQLPHERL